MTNGQVNYLSTSKYSDQIAKAASDWNAFGSTANIQKSGGSGPPTLLIEDADDLGLGWPAKYVRGRDGQPARIYLNRAYLENAEPEQIQGIIAHELGHSIGLSDAPGSGGIMGGSLGGAITGPNGADRAPYDSLDPSGAICGQQAPDEQFDPDGPAPITEENPNGCHIIADSPHIRQSTGGVGFKARVYCAVPTTVTATLILRRKACHFLVWYFCGDGVSTTIDTVTTKYPNKAAEFNNLSAPCANADMNTYFGVISTAWYPSAAGVATMERIPWSPDMLLPCGM
ncbi:zinc metalloprotease [Mycobacteroides abscessus]|uniref:hypothetical protein n=1 Tax=Mycobacteroides abscessus TaxID=36809 RepID=UPI0013F6870F|nr:hypothetical protein [Mycobacteroides abscessus]